ncbi:hypothetical protein [Streptomyces sp. NBC_00872]|uniref:hypothetical protein n=1 Tax=Streptomyces sp. NBC_00872 TaxID=2903686 RepID=UPI00386C22E6|nr:hypothetical protein OG214_17240 [Streptomyces sp. NBC_00872]
MPSDNHFDRAPDGPFDEGPFEDTLAEAMQRTGGTFTLQDRTGLVNNALTLGRRRLARRRTAAVTGSVLALAAVGIGGGYGAGLLGDPAGKTEWGAGPAGAEKTERGAGPAEPEKAQGPAEPEKARRVSEPGATPTGPAVAGGGIAAILTRLLPAGELTEIQERGIGELGGPGLTGVFDDGKGKAALSIGLSRANGLNGTQDVTCPDKVYVPYDHCTSVKRPDGGRLMIFQGYEYPDRREETKNWRAVLLTSDGFLIDASEYNAPAEKGAEISRTDPPLNPAQLKALVTSDKWRGTLERLPPAPPADNNPEDGAGGVVQELPGGVDARDILVTLLPRGLKVTGRGGEGPEFGYVVVDDGAGRTLVQINVQPGSSDLADELFTEATTLPDGTLLQTKKGPGDKGVPGGVMWTADTLRPDGLRVVISAFNGGDQHSPPTRATPALTMKQLTAIATSPKWRANY